MDIPAALAILDRLQLALQAARRDTAAVSAFTQAANTGVQPLLDALPPRFAEVWRNLLNRLESGALFDEESCSFSRRELLEQLQVWMDKARQRLTAA